MDKRVRKIAIIGAGGHAKVVLDAIRQIVRHNPVYEVAGFVDDVSGATQWCGYQVVSDIERLDAEHFIVAIGDNQVRNKKFESLSAMAYIPETIVHPSAILASDVEIGPGTVIMAGVVVNVGTKVGANCIINTSSSIDHDCKIGSHSHIAPGCILAGNILVGDGGFLGTGTKVIPRIEIGSWVTTGAGTVVIRNVPDGKKIVGVPARTV